MDGLMDMFVCKLPFNGPLIEYDAPTNQWFVVRPFKGLFERIAIFHVCGGW